MKNTAYSYSLRLLHFQINLEFENISQEVCGFKNQGYEHIVGFKTE